VSVLAIVGLSVIVGFWALLLGTIWTQNLVTRRRARRRQEPAHSISWIEFVPILMIAIATTFLLNSWHRGLGYPLVGGLHVALVLVIAAVALHRRAKSIK
jgi:hypothetical protein